MRPLTFSSNKHFIPVANKPLIFYPVEAVAETGIKEVAITYNPGGLEEALAILGSGSRWGLKFTYVLQEKPIGLANIFQVCEEYLLGEPFLLHLGDNIFVDGIKDLVGSFLEERPNALLTIVEHKDNKRMGVPFFDKKGRLVKYVEKPDNPPNRFGIPGLYFFDKNVFGCFKGKGAIRPSKRGELEIGSSYNWLLDHGFRIDVKEYKSKWLDPGKLDDWLEANQYLLDQNSAYKINSEIDPRSLIENRVNVGRHCWIANSHIRGPVMIGNNVTVKNSYIGPFTSIGDNCVIEDAHVENSVLMEGVRIIKVPEPIDTSLIGTGSEISKNGRHKSSMSLFIGEKCRVEV